MRGVKEEEGKEWGLYFQVLYIMFVHEWRSMPCASK